MQPGSNPQPDMPAETGLSAMARAKSALQSVREFFSTGVSPAVATRALVFVMAFAMGSSAIAYVTPIAPDGAHPFAHRGVNFSGLVNGQVLGVSTNGPTQNQFRYLRIQITRNGWVAINEVEVYDDTGAKITLDGAKAWGDCGQLCAGSSNPIGPDLAVDGNVSTIWNAGETAGNGCSWYGDNTARMKCIGSSRTGVWGIDLGAVKKVSRIRFITNGGAEETELVAVSNDNKNYIQIAKFQGSTQDPYGDSQWREIPGPTLSYSGDPTASITVNGRSSASLKTGADAAILEWHSSNADKANFSVSGKMGEGCPALSDPYRWRYFPAEGLNGTGNGGVGDQLNGQYFWDDLFQCSAGGSLTLTFTASQRGTGKSASSSVTLNIANTIANMPRTSNPNSPSTEWGFEINANYVVLAVQPGQSASSTIQINVSAGQYSNGLGQFSTAQYPMPILSTEGNVSQLHGTLERGNMINGGSSQLYTLTVSADNGLAPGVYKMRVYGNRSNGLLGYYDVPVFVLKDASVDYAGNRKGVLARKYDSTRGPDDTTKASFVVSGTTPVVTPPANSTTTPPSVVPIQPPTSTCPTAPVSAGTLDSLRATLQATAALQQQLQALITKLQTNKEVPTGQTISWPLQ